MLMNGAHYHLALNHLPIVIPIVALLVLAGGFLARSEAVKKTAFFIFILGALTSIPAFATGEGAEEVTENLQGVDKELIDIHEETAETFAVLSYILGGISLIALWATWKEKKHLSNILCLLIFVFGAAVLYFAKKTGTSGGEIRHSEIRGK